jgi:hypothetical protein
MPLDSVNWNNDSFKRRCIGWKLKWVLLPRKCYYTKKILWFKTAYKGTAMITGPGEPIFEDRWCEKNEFLLLKICGTI